jgi:hypothetical protein
LGRCQRLPATHAMTTIKKTPPTHLVTAVRARSGGKHADLASELYSCTGRNAVTHKLADEPAGEPQPAGVVEESRELRGDAAVPASGSMSMSMGASMNVIGDQARRRRMLGSPRDGPGGASEKHAVDLLEVIRCEEGVLWLERRPAVHLGEHLLGKRLLAADQGHQPRKPQTMHLVPAHIW